ncbi:GNAT family N-acetyltransferase [Chloroflexus sp.]|uniref:GNAT family N-acetyltransferase n=1 Tax=Chloroflexus sp. TaxID=1904827 RepID=UPI002624134C|nr:GNAT family N-acetyltransferase [uncultured Chloroflexus sp.]
MLSIIITRAQTDEATTLKQIAIAAKRYWNYPDHLIAQWAATPIIDPAAIGRDLVFVARIDDRPVGWYRLMVDRLPAILEDLWVTPEWIGQGLGRALLNHATIECRKRGIDQIELEADPNALGFYLRMGGTVIGERMSEWNRPVPLVRITLMQPLESSLQ